LESKLLPLQITGCAKLTTNSSWRSERLRARRELACGYPDGVGVGVGVCGPAGASFFCESGEHWMNAMLQRMHPAAIMHIKIFRFITGIERPRQS